jgi:flagellum-specific ATP synthase
MLETIEQYRTNLDFYQNKIVAKGRLVRVSGLILEASGCKTELGGICSIKGDHEDMEAEVIGFEGDRIFMMPVGSMARLRPGAEVIPLEDKKIGVGVNYLGRILDGNGSPLDGKGEIQASETVSLFNSAINPLHRQPIREILDTGIGAINSLITVGRGQRLGLFAGSGVGKSVLMGMMTKHTEADVIIVGLIGERGREVKEFIEDILDKKSLARAVVIAAPADDSPTMKIRGANLATRFAEYFRDQGKQVLLLMDSLTRFAQAQRQISLAVGEPPSTKGYPPSVFAKLPELVERAGNGAAGSGSITAFYTVLTEGDDMQDPVADSARAILDGHVVLSRELADSGHFPAIDIEASISRTMPNIVTPEHRMLATKFRQSYSLYRRNEDLITVGAYTAGNDVELDYAVEKFPQLKSFLKQDILEQLRLKPCLEKMGKIV